MDSERIAELKNDKEEIPESILERAREELLEKALEGLTFDTVLEAITERDPVTEGLIVSYLKDNQPGLAGCRLHAWVLKYLEPSPESVQQRAEEILAELDDRKGEDI